MHVGLERFRSAVADRVKAKRLDHSEKRRGYGGQREGGDPHATPRPRLASCLDPEAQRNGERSRSTIERQAGSLYPRPDDSGDEGRPCRSVPCARGVLRVSLQPFFRHLGSKYLSGAYYPPPRFGTIIEPFAGGAGYATRYHRRKVILVERDPEVARVWRYLIGASAREILALPDLPEGGSLDDVRCSDDVRALISRNLNLATGPRKRFTAWRDAAHRNILWGPNLRARLAAQVERIRHWRVIEGDYTKAPDVEATWFVDPPYQKLKARMYAFDADALDFASLGAWCKARRGQVMVCEQAPAAWLPFRAFRETLAAHRGRQKSVWRSAEVIWTHDDEEKTNQVKPEAIERRRAAR